MSRHHQGHRWHRQFGIAFNYDVMLNDKHSCADPIYIGHLFGVTTCWGWSAQLCLSVNTAPWLHRQDGYGSRNSCRHRLRQLVQLSATGAIVKLSSSQSTQFCGHNSLLCFWGWSLLCVSSMINNNNCWFLKKNKVLPFLSTIIYIYM